DERQLKHSRQLDNLGKPYLSDCALLQHLTILTGRSSSGVYCRACQDMNLHYKVRCRRELSTCSFFKRWYWARLMVTRLPMRLSVVRKTFSRSNTGRFTPLCIGSRIAAGSPPSGELRRTIAKRSTTG